MNKILLICSLLCGCSSSLLAQDSTIKFSILDIDSKEGANINMITSLDNKIAFVAERKSGERKLFTYNEQNGINELLKKDDFGILSSNKSLVKLNTNNLFFVSEKNSKSYLNIVNLQNSEAQEIKELFYFDNEYALYQDKLFYLAKESNNSSKKNIYVSDGTKNGTKIIVTENLSDIRNLKNSNNELLFTATENSIIQIYKITEDLKVKKISDFTSSFSGFSEAISFNNSYYIGTSNYVDFPEIKKCTNGKCETFLKYKNNNIATNFNSFIFDNRLYFGYTKGESYEDLNELYSTDGTVGNTVKVDTENQKTYLLDNKLKYINFKNNIYIILQEVIGGQYSNSLFKLENNQLKKFYTIYSTYSDLYASENNIYFLGNNYEDYNNIKLIKSDGTITGTLAVDETKNYSNSLGIINNNIYYQKSDELNGNELWTYDENTNTNKFIRNINYQNSGEVIDMTPIGNNVFFKGNINKAYSTSGSVVVNHPTSLEKESYGKQSFIESNDDVISVSSIAEKHVFSILNESTQKFDPILTVSTGFEGYPNLIQTIGDNVYFKSHHINDPKQYYNLQLNYFNKKTKEIGAVKKPDNTFIQKLGSNYTGLYEYNGNYYYTTDGDNKGTILQLNPTINTTSIAYQFKSGYDSDQAIFVAKFKDKIIVEHAGQLYYFDGQTMTKFADGKGLKLYFPKKISQNTYATINDKLLFLKPTANDYIFELWSTDGKNEENLKLNLEENLHSFQNCNNKFYFVAGKYLYETNGSAIGTKFIDIMDHGYNINYTSIKCYKDNLFYVGDYYGSKINVINGNDNKAFDIKFNELPDLVLNLNYVYDMEIINDKVFLNMYHHYAGKEVFVTNFKDFNLVDLSINDQDNQNYKKDKILVYPNPFDNQLTIKRNSNEVIKEVRLYDLLGKIIFTKKINNQEVKLSTEQLKQGVYLLQTITTDNKIYTNKLIKN